MTKAGPALRLDGQGKPLWLVCELTYRCPLQCPWCNNPLEFASINNELSTEEWKRVLRESRALGSLQLGFTGGEPALRQDLEELVAEADKLGFYTNLITSTVGLSRDRLARLKAAGLKQIQVSLQSHDATTTNALVGAPVHLHKIFLPLLQTSLTFGLMVLKNANSMSMVWWCVPEFLPTGCPNWTSRCWSCCMVFRKPTSCGIVWHRP